MSLQGVYDMVGTHLLKQRARAVHDGRLMYRTPSGLTDPIGCLIHKHLYHTDMEGYAFKGVDTWHQYDSNGGLTKLKNALDVSGVDVDDEKTMRLITDLQRLHDDNEAEFWYDRLVAVGRTWRLHTYVIDDLRPIPAPDIPPVYSNTATWTHAAPTGAPSGRAFPQSHAAAMLRSMRALRTPATTDDDDGGVEI